MFVFVLFLFFGLFCFSILLLVRVGPARELVEPLNWKGPTLNDVRFKRVEILNLKRDGSKGETTVGGKFAIASTQRFRAPLFKKGAHQGVEDMPERVLLDPSELDKRFDGFLVETTFAEIKRDCDEYSVDKSIAKHMFNWTHKNIFKYTTKSLDREYQKNSKAWTDWCNDVHLHFCARFGLFASPMPIKPVKRAKKPTSEPHPTPPMQVSCFVLFCFVSLSSPSLSLSLSPQVRAKPKSTAEQSREPSQAD